MNEYITKIASFYRILNAHKTTLFSIFPSITYDSL